MSTSARMLQLLSMLQTHRYWPGGELSGRLGVSPRTLRRDVERLRGLGYPVDATRGTAGGYQLRSGTAMPPLLLDDDEAVAIAVGLRTAAGGSVEGIEETSVRALTKVVQVMPPRLRSRVDALREFTVPTPSGQGPVVRAHALATLAGACRDDERIRFSYRAPDREPARRHVEPHRVVSLGRRWYLVAFDLDRDAWRSFRVDRMDDATTTGSRFRPRDLPGGDASQFVRDGTRSAPRRHHVVVRFACPAARVTPVVGHWGVVRDTDAGCELTMDLDDLAWPVSVVAAVGEPFTVVTPPELLERVAETGQLLTRSAASPAADPAAR